MKKGLRTWSPGRHLGKESSSAGQSMRPGAGQRKGARPRLRAFLVSSPVSQCMLLLQGLSSSPQARPSPPPVPSGPSKADFPCRRASHGGLQPGTGGRQGRQGEAEEASEPASEPEEGAGLWPVTELKIVLALTCRPEGACGTNRTHRHTHTVREFIPCTNKHIQYTARPLDFNGTCSLTLWYSCIK